MLLCTKLTGNSILIMVVYKGVQTASDSLQTAYIVGDFKEIVVVKAGVNALVEFVVGYRVEHMVIDPAAIVSVDDFSHEPEILFHGFRFPAHFFHKMEIKYVCAVQTDAVNVKGVDPEPDHVKEIPADLGIGMVETGKFKMSLPGLIAERVSQRA